MTAQERNHLIHPDRALGIRLWRTRPSPCPYLDGRSERQLFTMLDRHDSERARTVFDVLSHQGFRRSQDFMYRPVCEGCSCCISIRVPVNLWSPSSSQKRIQKRNRRFSSRIVPAQAKECHYDLFCRYVKARHAGGPMAGMEFRDYEMLFAASKVESEMMECFDGTDTLVSVCFFDRMSDGLSAVYSFFDPNRAADSLGLDAILRLLSRTREQGGAYLYLGYWVEGSRTMSYKTRFRPLEGYVDNRWQRLDGPAVKAGLL